MTLKKPKTPKSKQKPVDLKAEAALRKQHRTEVVPLSKMQPAAYNPRRITKGAKQGLRNTIERFGLVQHIVWNERTGNIVGGHQRYEVLKEMGETEIETIVVNLSEQDEKVLNLSLNNPAIQGSWDDELLATLSQDLGSIEQLGDVFGELHLDDLLGFTLGDPVGDLSSTNPADASFDEEELEEGDDGEEAGTNDDDTGPPDAFPRAPVDGPTDHVCPRCNYVWNGKPS